MGTGEGWDCSLVATDASREDWNHRMLRVYASPRPGLELFILGSRLDYHMYLVTRSPLPRKMPRHRRVSVPAQFRSTALSLHPSRLDHTKHSTTYPSQSPTPNNVHTMVLGRLTHYAFDALAISVVLAGVKRQTGFGYVPPLSLPLFRHLLHLPATSQILKSLAIGERSTGIHP